MKKIIITICLLCLTGCYNHNELNEISITTATAITKENDKFHILVQTANPNTSSNSNKTDQPDFIIYESYGKSLNDAYRSLITQSVRRIYFNHLEILLISEDIAKENLPEILDFFLRDPEIRMEFYVLVARNDNNNKLNTLKILTPLSNLSSKSIKDNLMASTKYIGISNNTTFGDLINNYLNPYTEIALPSIKIIGNEEEAKSEDNLKVTQANADTEISNMAIFKENKFLGYLSKEESIAYNFVTNNIDKTLIQYECKDNQYLVTQLSSTSSKVKANIKDNQITINIKADGNITEVDCPLDLTQNKVILDIEKKVNKKVEKNTKKAIQNIIKQYNSDIFGFKDLFYKTDAKYYHQIEKKWDNQIFPNLKIKVNSNIKVFAKGNGIKGALDND